MRLRGQHPTKKNLPFLRRPIGIDLDEALAGCMRLEPAGEGLRDRHDGVGAPEDFFDAYEAAGGRPVDRRAVRYWEIVGNINGDIFDSIECKKATMWGCDLDMAQNLPGLKFVAKVRGTVNNPADKDEGFTAEMAVPCASSLPSRM